MKMPRPSKHTLRMLVLLLIYSGGGATINVAVAWGCSAFSLLRSPVWSYGYSATDQQWLADQHWPHLQAHDQFDYAYGGRSMSGFGVEYRALAEERQILESQRWSTYGESVPLGWEIAITVEAGWPTLCLNGWYYDKRASNRSEIPESLHLSNAASGLPLLHSPSKSEFAVVVEGWLAAPELDGRMLPFHPLWPGFVINSLVYAGLLWMLFAGRGTVRRFIRRKRGCCAGCGYNLRGQVTAPAPGSPAPAPGIRCPECGAAVASTP
jgi:hypothetical protein